MVSRRKSWFRWPAIGLCLGALPALAQQSSILFQCPTQTLLHPTPGDPAIRCDHLVAGDGMVTMADDAGKQMYIFSFARLPGGPGTPAPNSRTGRLPASVRSSNISARPTILVAS